MSDPISFDEHAERLKIRSSPKPVTRINRKALMVGAGLGVLALFGAASIALQPPKPAGSVTGTELYNVENTRKPDGLAALPTSYGEVRPSPILGPPLAGDLGSTILRAEKDLGIEPEYVAAFEADFRPNPEDEAARAARMRAAAIEEEAARAPVFFQLQSQASLVSRATSKSSTAPQLPSELLALATSGVALPTGFQTTSDTNMQARKIDFAGDQRGADVYNTHQVLDPLSPYQVMAGTLIPASLVTGINSDLPGSIVAQVTQPVFDTVTGQYLLIPQGSRLLGRYQSEVSFGQDRALLIWDRMIFPDGSSIQISEPGTDAQGFAGLSDRTDHHWDRVFAAAGLATILGIGAELGSDDDDEIARTIQEGAGQSVHQAGQRVVDRNLNIQPTITVRPGSPIRVLVTRDLILRPHT